MYNKLLGLVLSVVVIGTMSACDTDKTMEHKNVEASNSIENVNVDDKETEEVEEKPVTEEKYIEEPTGNGESAVTDGEPISDENCEEAFYGIWCYGSKDLSEAQEYLNETLMKHGFQGEIFITTDWSNLNEEKWYVVTAGIYYTKEDAEADLGEVKKLVPDAYIKYSGSYKGDVTTDNAIEDLYVSGTDAFYGIWCAASKDKNEMERFAEAMRTNHGIDASVYITTDWENLNEEKWYVVSAGVYESEEEAKKELTGIQYVYPDAYVKYSGGYIGNDRIMYTVYSLDQISEGGNYFDINVLMYKPNIHTTLRIDEATEFAPSCDMQYFANYRSGDTVLEWYQRSYRLAKDGEPTMAVLGVFEVSITGDHVDTIYGTYWWD